MPWRLSYLREKKTFGWQRRGLLHWGPREVVLTHRDGVLVYDGDAFHEADFFPKKLVGRSGRGDTCVASYVARRLNGPPSDAILWAAALTSLKMEAEGPFKRDLREVEELIQEKVSIEG